MALAGPPRTALVLPHTELVAHAAKTNEVETFQNVPPVNYSHALMNMIFHLSKQQ